MFKISESYLSSPRGFGPSRAGRAGGKMGKATKQVAGLVSTAGTGFALGFVEAKYGMPLVPGVNISVDIVGAGALHALIFLAGDKLKLDKDLFSGVTGADLLTGMANGAATYWAGIQGAIMGGATMTGAAGKAMTGAAHRPGAMGMGSPRGNYTPETAWQGQFR